MNIPDEVIERVTGMHPDDREYPDDVRKDFHSAAEWARKEALRDVRAVLAAPSTVLAAVKRETAAQAWDRGFEAGEQDVMEHNRTSWSSDCIANPYRSGTEGSDRG